jgi:hypothetical protein
VYYDYYYDNLLREPLKTSVFSGSLKNYRPHIYVPPFPMAGDNEEPRSLLLGSSLERKFIVPSPAEPEIRALLRVVDFHSLPGNGSLGYKIFFQNRPGFAAGVSTMTPYSLTWRQQDIFGGRSDKKRFSGRRFPDHAEYC